jgi:hypothetical protein
MVKRRMRDLAPDRDVPMPPRDRVVAAMSRAILGAEATNPSKHMESDLRKDLKLAIEHDPDPRKQTESCAAMAEGISDSRLSARILDLAPRPGVGTVACAIFAAVRRLGEAQTRMLGHDALAQLAGRPCARQDLADAAALLARDEIGVLAPFGMVHDPEEDEIIELLEEDFAEFLATGVAVHPLSGEIIPGAAVSIFHASRAAIFDAPSPEWH